MLGCHKGCNLMILVTGGAGYIGSHTTVALLEAGYEVVIIDNLCNSTMKSLHRVKKICGRAPTFVRGDIRDSDLLRYIFAEYEFTAVVHFAGLKSVAESVEQPLVYYDNNVCGTVTLCQAMAAAGVFNLVFSSSATVYGSGRDMPLREDCPLSAPVNPYGHSKLMVENVLTELARYDHRWHFAFLRYFNPIGAHKSGLIGEDPKGRPNNLLPYISQVAIGKLNILPIFGGDYPTVDGTGVRDYIHVVDLAYGHLKTLEALETRKGVNVWNLGTGNGYSVLQIVEAFERASGQSVPYEIKPRRAGDVAECWADPSKALEDLGWRASLDLSDMVLDAWRWQLNNPNGYST